MPAGRAARRAGARDAEGLATWPGRHAGPDRMPEDVRRSWTSGDLVATPLARARCAAGGVGSRGQSLGGLAYRRSPLRRWATFLGSLPSRSPGTRTGAACVRAAAGMDPVVGRYAVAATRRPHSPDLTTRTVSWRDAWRSEAADRRALEQTVISCKCGPSLAVLDRDPALLGCRMPQPQRPGPASPGRHAPRLPPARRHADQLSAHTASSDRPVAATARRPKAPVASRPRLDASNYRRTCAAL